MKEIGSMCAKIVFFIPQVSCRQFFLMVKNLKTCEFAITGFKNQNILVNGEK